MSVWSENRTKILGATQSAVGYISAGIAAGMFTGLLEAHTVQWIGIMCGLAVAVLGHFTTAVGIKNSTMERVAEAHERVAEARATVAVAQAATAATIESALNAQPPGDPR
jgi:cytochrome c biogenesis protein CcdA